MIFRQGLPAALSKRQQREKTLARKGKDQQQVTESARSMQTDKAFLQA
jgi:hypothetical protein